MIDITRNKNPLLIHLSSRIKKHEKKKIILIYLFTVPPDISDEDSSSDVTTKEGEDASLYCSASGHPTPRITWRREDGSAISLRPTGVNLKKGNLLLFFIFSS